MPEGFSGGKQKRDWSKWKQRFKSAGSAVGRGAKLTGKAGYKAATGQRARRFGKWAGKKAWKASEKGAKHGYQYFTGKPKRRPSRRTTRRRSKGRRSSSSSRKFTITIND